MKKNNVVMGLFGNFDEAFAAVADIRAYKVPGVSVDDVTLQSPIEHPEVEEVLGDRPVYVQKFTFFGALFGMTFGFIFLAAAQATFLVQPQGGKPVVPLPSNLVLTYEMMILAAMLITLAGFIIGARLLRKRNSLYSEKVSLDQIAVILQIEGDKVQGVKDLFSQHKALEIREEVIK